MSTLYFPQLSVGSLAQYPISRRWSKICAMNRMQDGSTIAMASPTPSRVWWELQYAGLSADEWTALETLFTNSQGRFGTFTFLDPTDNLLASSESFTASDWAADPLLTITPGTADPLGGAAGTAVTNSGQSPQHLLQALAVPSWFQYCFSIYLRADAPCTIGLVRSSAGHEARETLPVTTNWARAVTSGVLGGQDETASFGIELDAGKTVSVFGAQVEAQPSPGIYKKKSGRSGVYLKSRFDQDALVQTANAVGQYDTTVQIIANF